MCGHRLIDLTGQFDEPRIEVVLLRLPAQIKRIDRNTWSTEAWPRIKGMKAKRLGRSRVDHLPYVHTHAQRKNLQFVHQCDIDAAIDVLEQLGHLCRAR